MAFRFRALYPILASILDSRMARKQKFARNILSQNKTKVSDADSS